MHKCSAYCKQSLVVISLPNADLPGLCESATLNCVEEGLKLHHKI